MPSILCTRILSKNMLTSFLHWRVPTLTIQSKAETEVGTKSFFSFTNIMVFCYQNCSDLLWEKIVLLIEKKLWLYYWELEIWKKIFNSCFIWRKEEEFLILNPKRPGLFGLPNTRGRNLPILENAVLLLPISF